jgi:GT2 family glycosyltransferase
MARPLITVAIVSWLLEERLIKTLQSIPKTTALPLNLCLHVQGEEQISASTKQRIIDAASGFVEKDIYFSSSNAGIAGPRARNLVRAATTDFIFMSDNDMDYRQGTIDAELEFLQSHTDYGMVDVLNNQVHWHRTVNGTKVTCLPIDSINTPFSDVDLIGGTSQLIRQEVALIEGIIDTRYCIGSWDFDFSMNVRAKGWKVATLNDRNLVAVNDKTQRSGKYKATKLKEAVIQKGRRLFESKWGFSCMEFPNNRVKVASSGPLKVSIISRAIYSKMGPTHGMGVLDEAHLDMLQKYFINSLKMQTDKDFDVYLAVGPEDNETTQRIKALDWDSLNIHFLYTSGDTTQWNKSVSETKNWGRETDPGSPEYILKYLDYPRTPIMARMDIDDWVAPGWVAHMKFMANTIKEDRFLINYQIFGQAPDGQIYTFYAPHRKNRTSPFIALVQRTKIETDLYETVHLRMGSLFKVVYTIPPSYAFMVVHGGNRSNQVYELDHFNYVKEVVDNIGGKPSMTTSDNFRPKLIKTSWRDKLLSTPCESVSLQN